MATKAPPKKLASLNELFMDAALLRIKIAEVEADLRALKEERDDIEQRILDAMIESGTEAHRVAAAGMFSIKRATVPTVTNWAVLDKFILKTKSLDLLHRRLTATAWNARIEAGEKVPGVEATTVTSLVFTRAK